MEFFELYGRHLGELIAWLSKPETNIPAIKLIQATAALIGAAISVLGFYKAWRYAERRLGQRLIEFLEHQEAGLVAARQALRVAHNSRAVEEPNPAGLFTRRELRTVLKPLDHGLFTPTKKILKEALDRTTEREQLARQKGDLHLQQKAMAYLLLGAIDASEGNHQDALRHFLSALDIDGHDLEALEYVGFQYLRLGDGANALGIFSRLEKIARARGDSLLVSTALRDCGLAYEKLPTPSYFNANVSFKDAIDEFPKDGPAFELASIHELRAQANIQLKRPKLAHACLTRALVGYSALEHGGHKDAKAARAGVKRVNTALEALKQLRATASDEQPIDDGSDDTNGSGSAQLQPDGAMSVRLSQQQSSQQSPDSERPN